MDRDALALDIAELKILSRGILADATVDVEEARVLRRWLHAHRVVEGDFDFVIAQLDRFLEDGAVQAFESRAIAQMLGHCRQTLIAHLAD